MKARSVRGYIRQVSARVVYTRPVKAADPYQLLAMAIILQACLDSINYSSPKHYHEFLEVLDLYSDACGLNISYDQYWNSVRNNMHKWCDGRAQHTATAFMFF